jgi:ribosome maturation factor RimP
VAPFFLPDMETNTSTENRVEALLQPLLEGTDIFLTAIYIKPTNNIKVYLDADSGLDIGRSATINRKLYHLIEEAAWYPDGNFSLEVSSPGVDEPLKSIRQYKKNVGRTLEVTPNEGVPVTGQLKEVGEDGLVLAIKGTKKEPPKELEIPFSGIKTAVVQIVF